MDQPVVSCLVKERWRSPPVLPEAGSGAHKMSSTRAWKAYPSGTAEASFIAEVLADAAANSWAADQVELPSTEADAELLELLSDLEGDVAEMVDCLQQTLAQSLANEKVKKASKEELDAFVPNEDGALDGLPVADQSVRALLQSCLRNLNYPSSSSRVCR
jgi:hypothetical protein